jgi:hypothetical protein
MENLAYAGGFVLDTYDGRKIVSTNITTDASGIPYYNEAIFIQTIRTGQIGARTRQCRGGSIET